MMVDQRWLASLARFTKGSRLGLHASSPEAADVFLHLVALALWLAWSLIFGVSWPDSNSRANFGATTQRNGEKIRHLIDPELLPWGCCSWGDAVLIRLLFKPRFRHTPPGTWDAFTASSSFLETGRAYREHRELSPPVPSQRHVVLSCTSSRHSPTVKGEGCTRPVSVRTKWWFQSALSWGSRNGFGSGCRGTEGEDMSRLEHRWGRNILALRCPAL